MSNIPRTEFSVDDRGNEAIFYEKMPDSSWEKAAVLNREAGPSPCNQLAWEEFIHDSGVKEWAERNGYASELEIIRLESELAEARAEIERLKQERTIAGIHAHCEMEENDNEYVLQRNELEAARAEIDRKDALIKQMVEALALGSASVLILHGRNSAEYKQMLDTMLAVKGAK